MKNRKSLINNRIFNFHPNSEMVALFFLYLILLSALVVPHELQNAHANKYLGMQEWEMNAYGSIFLLICTLVSIPLLFKRRFLPSDFFVVLYFLVVVTPFFALYSASGYVNDAMLLPAFFVLVIPLLAVLLFRKVSIVFLKVSLFSKKSILYLLLVMIAVVVTTAYFNATESASFVMQNSYTRRLEGRELYTGSILAYFIAMSTNMLTPLFAFMGIVTKRYMFVVVSVCIALFFFWLLGIKATFLYLLTACGLGYLFIRKKIEKFSQYLLLAIGVLFLIFSVEWLLNGYSLVADYFFRRLFSAVAQTQGYYLDVIFNSHPSCWDFVTGGAEEDFAITFYIGKKYSGNHLANANSNTFLYAFAQNGLLGYVSALIVISLIFSFLDSLYRRYHDPIHIFVGFIFATLILEQGYTTALLSSGVGLMLLLSFLLKTGNLTYDKNKEGMGEGRKGDVRIERI